MNIKEEINNNLVKALKAKEREKASVLRGLLASLKNAEIEAKGELKNRQVIEVLQREVKQRKEAATDYKRGKREEIAEKEEAEVKIIKEYLPAEISEEEIEAEVKKAIEETGASSKQDLGKAMGIVMAKLKGRVDGSKVKNTALKLLS